VTVIEHFRIWQVNQISLPLIVNATDDSATTLEVTTNKARSAVMQSPLMECAYNFINLQTSDVAFSLFFESWDSVTAVGLSCRQVLLQTVWKQQLHRHAINTSKLQHTPLTSFAVKLCVCVKLILLGYVSESGTTLNVLNIWIGCNKSWWKTCRS